MGLPAASVYQGTHMISGLGIDKPEYLDVLYGGRGDQYKSAYKIIQMLGFMLPVAQETFGHFEDDWYIQSLTIDGDIISGTGGTNAAVVINLAAAEQFQDSLPTPAQHIFGRVGDQVMFPNIVGGTKDLEGIITAVTPATPSITVKLLQTAWTYPTIPSGSKIIIISSAFSEASGGPLSVTGLVNQRTNTVQRIKEAFSISDVEATNQKWFDTLKWHGGGKNLRPYMLKGQMEAEYRYMQKCDGAWLFGQERIGTLIDPISSTGHNVNTTKGMVPTIRSLGFNYPYSIGFFDMDDFDGLAANAQSARAGTDHIFFMSYPLAVELENTLFEFLKYSDVSYVADTMFGGDMKKAVAVNFGKVHKAGHSFWTVVLDHLSHPELYGAAGFTDKQNLGIVAPWGKRASTSLDKMTTTDVPTFGSRYKAYAGLNQQYKMYKLSGPIGEEGEVIVHAEGRTDWHIVGTLACHIIGANGFQLVEGS